MEWSIALYVCYPYCDRVPLDYGRGFYTVFCPYSRILEGKNRGKDRRYPLFSINLHAGPFFEEVELVNDNETGPNPYALSDYHHGQIYQVWEEYSKHLDDFADGIYITTVTAECPHCHKLRSRVNSLVVVSLYLSPRTAEEQEKLLKSRGPHLLDRGIAKEWRDFFVASFARAEGDK